MCKSDTIVMIDSNDRTASSNSTSDFTVNLSSSLLIDDNHGIQLKSLYIPNTLTTINTGNNDKLYTSLNDGTTITYHTLTIPAESYDSSTMNTFTADLQTLLNTAYPPPVVSINGAVGNWTGAGNVILLSGYTYQREDGTTTFEFTEWNSDAETGNC